MTNTSAISNLAPSIRVLLIEDSLSDGRILKDALCVHCDKQNFNVTISETLGDGMARIDTGDMDVVLLDLNLPDSSGFETFERFVTAFPTVPVVVLTSIGGEEIARQAMSSGAQDYLHKDHLDPYWIAQSIRRAIERFRLAESLRQAKAELQSASEAKSTFLAHLSHEIRNPMASIIMATEAMKQEGLNKELHDLVEIVSRNGHHTLSLLNDILDLAKVEAGWLTVEAIEVSPKEVAADVLTMIRPSANAKGLSLLLDWDSSLPDTVITDPTRLRQILTNLVSNAVKFTSNGHIDVHLGTTCDENGKELLAISVTDTGCGLTTEQQSKLFRPYTQAQSSTARVYGGTGLGLSLSRKLAQALGGQVDLQRSSPGVGSTFQARVAMNLGHDCATQFN